ncbi:hypothetical protein E2C01_000171 [Portunus trituberculatus]|uniref:Uncharacterized protein n=1 Tax=Portunus trituberculatus TaxID=210409 RepID=A0A5B7CDY4_PORTR|nr:hypothetical protein [Portunus trituberculatus]
MLHARTKHDSAAGSRQELEADNRLTLTWVENSLDGGQCNSDIKDGLVCSLGAFTTQPGTQRSRITEMNAVENRGSADDSPSLLYP